MREWVGVKLVMLLDAAETLALHDLQLFSCKNHPRTLWQLGFSVFVCADRFDLIQQRGHSRNRTLKTRYGRELKLLLLKSLGNEGIYKDERVTSYGSSLPGMPIATKITRNLASQPKIA